MLISRKIKLTFIWVSLLVLVATMLIGLAPIKQTSALPDESKDRIYISALAYCLYYELTIRENDNQSGDITSYWDREGDYEIVPVGYLIQTDGMMTCNEILGPAMVALGFATAETPVTEMRSILEKKILRDQSNPPDGVDDDLSGFSGDGIDGNKFEGLARDFIRNTLVDQYLDPSKGLPTSLPAITSKEKAERSLAIVNFCIEYQRNTFITKNEPKPAVFDKVSLADGSIINLNFKLINATTLVEALSINSENDEGYLGNGYFGDDDLAATVGGTGVDGGGLPTWSGEGIPGPFDDLYSGWSPFVFGLDNRKNMTKDGYDLDNEKRMYDDNIDALIACDFIERNMDIFQHYELNAEGELTFDGITFAEQLESSAEDVNLNLANDAGPTCEGADALGWIMCPVITGIYSISEFIFTKTIVPFLKVEPVNTSSGTIYAIWSSFRTIGNILLIFGLLFIVFGQAIGGGLVDAYTAKKSMPRIFVAAILINLSIYIVAILVDITNILGQGVGSLLLSPANSVGASYQLDGIVGLLGTILAVGIPLLLVVALKTRKNDNTQVIMLYLAVFFGIPILILIFGIFATLIIRLGLILLLTALSPVALALFVMPATEKWAKKWFDLFIKTLLVYPIMMAIFAVASLLSIVMSQSVGGVDWGDVGVALAAAGVAGVMTKSAGVGVGVGAVGLLVADGKDILVSLMSIIVLFAPLALIPFAFKLAGGIMGSTIGLATKARSKVSHKMETAKHRPGFYNPESGRMEYDVLANIQHQVGHRFKNARSKGIGNFLAGTPEGTTNREALGILNPFSRKRTRAQRQERIDTSRTDRLDQHQTGGARGVRVVDRRAAASTRPDSAATDSAGAYDQFVDITPPDTDPGGNGSAPGGAPPPTTPPTPPTTALPASEPISLQPKPVGWTPPSRQNVDDLKNRFGNQQQSNAEDITPEDISFT